MQQPNTRCRRVLCPDYCSPFITPRSRCEAFESGALPWREIGKLCEAVKRKCRRHTRYRSQRAHGPYSFSRRAFTDVFERVSNIHQYQCRMLMMWSRFHPLAPCISIQPPHFVTTVSTIGRRWSNVSLYHAANGEPGECDPRWWGSPILKIWPLLADNGKAAPNGAAFCLSIMHFPELDPIGKPDCLGRLSPTRQLPARGRSRWSSSKPVSALL